MKQKSKNTLKSQTSPLDLFIYLSLTVMVLLVFWQVRGFDFVNFDDGVYVYENPQVLNGLTKENLALAFTEYSFGYWQPLTWISLMLNSDLLGADPGGFHLVNLLLHLASTLLLFAVFRKMTGALWPSLFVAAAFAIHPMHVESVAWISERKDVLSTFFMMLTLFTYIGYTKHSSLLRYVLSLTFFALGLMAKPMLVTLPFVLLLLDYWPLNRFEFPRFNTISDLKKYNWRIIIEKVPYFIFSAVLSVVTYLTQGSDDGLIAITIKEKISNAFSAYAVYLGKLFWPVNLSAYYPSEALDTIPLWAIVLYGLFMVGVTVLIFYRGRRSKYLLVGWLWFVGTLIPVVGIIRFTGSLYGDRFTYIPYIGLFIMIAWGVPELLSRWQNRKDVLGLSMVIVLVLMGVLAYRQVGVWKNGVTLFSHAVEVTENNYVGYSNLASAYYERAQYNKAIEASKQAIKIKPDHAKAHNNLGGAYQHLGQNQKAIEAFKGAIEITPDDPRIYNNLGLTYYHLSRFEEAIEAYEEAIKINPQYVEAYNNLGAAYKGLGRYEEMIQTYKEAININPLYLDVYNNLGVEYNNLGRHEDAIKIFEQLIKVAPENPQAYYNLGNAYSHLGRWSEAISAFNQALKIYPQYPHVHYNIGVVYSKLNRWDSAIGAFWHAIKIAPNDPAAHLGLGVAYLQTGDHASALNEYNILKVLDPKMANDLFRMMNK